MNNNNDNTEQQEQTVFFRDCLHLGWEHSETLAKAQQRWPDANYGTLEYLLNFAAETPCEKEPISVLERATLLAGIARGEIEFETRQPRYDPATKELIGFQKIGKASHRDRIAALAELNRMAEKNQEMQFMGEEVIVVEPVRTEEDETGCAKQLSPLKSAAWPMRGGLRP